MLKGPMVAVSEDSVAIMVVSLQLMLILLPLGQRFNATPALASFPSGSSLGFFEDSFLVTVELSLSMSSWVHESVREVVTQGLI